MSEANTPSREVVAPDNSTKSLWDTIEGAARTLSIIAIPVVLAIGGWIIQKRLQDQSISRDYVQLAVSILKEPEGGKIKPEMRAWAVQLLNDNSPTKLTPAVEDQLKNGEVYLPASYNPSSNAGTTAPAAGATSKDEALTLESQGFASIVNKDVESALQSFTAAEKLWPTLHNVKEIRQLLEQNKPALVAAPKDTKSYAWTNFCETLLSKYSWGMPEDIKTRLKAEL